MPHGGPEGLYGLAREGAPRLLGDGHRYHYGDFPPHFALEFLYCEDGRLGVEGVEHGLDQDGVGTAVHQAARLFVVGLGQFCERHVARCAVPYAGSDGGGFGGRAHAPRHKPRLGFGRECVRFAAGYGCGGAGDAVDIVFQAVFAQRYGIGAERVGGDYVGPGLEIGAVDGGDLTRGGEAENVYTTRQRAFVADEFAATVVTLGQTQSLHHGAQTAVQQQDAVVE